MSCSRIFYSSNVKKIHFDDELTMDATDEKGSALLVDAFLDAASYGHLELVQQILDERPEFLKMAKDRYKNTALHLASAYGQIYVVCLLTELGGREILEMRGQYGRTPLLMACQTGQLPVVKFLVQSGANIDASDSCEDGLSDMALHLASACGHVEVVDYLLQNKPSLLENAKDKFKDTALNKAAIEGQIKVVKYLVLEKGANVENAGHLGRTPLLQAAQEGHLNVVRFLVEQGEADIFVKDVSALEDMAIHLAAYQGHASVVDYFLTCSPDLIGATNGLGQTPLFLALSQRNKDVIHLLKARGAKI